MKDGKENVGDDRKEMAEVDREAGNEEEEGGRWKGKIGEMRIVCFSRFTIREEDLRFIIILQNRNLD